MRRLIIILFFILVLPTLSVAKPLITYNYELDDIAHTINTGEAIDFIVRIGNGKGWISCGVDKLFIDIPQGNILFQAANLNWSGSNNSVGLYILTSEKPSFNLGLMQPTFSSKDDDGHIYFINASDQPDAKVLVRCEYNPGS